MMNNDTFKDREGKVIEINFEKQHVIVEIDFFGRNTPTTFFIKEIKLKST